MKREYWLLLAVVFGLAALLVSSTTCTHIEDGRNDVYIRFKCSK